MKNVLVLSLSVLLLSSTVAWGQDELTDEEDQAEVQAAPQQAQQPTAVRPPTAAPQQQPPAPPQEPPAPPQGQQAQAGLTCNGVAATLTTSFASCPASQYGSTLIKIPGITSAGLGTADDDHNPSRIAPRNLFDVSFGDDNLFHKDRYRWSARVTVINVTNKLALYNFLSTFSGTHYITPRTLTGELGFHF